jgi:hypothetical protein
MGALTVEPGRATCLVVGMADRGGMQRVMTRFDGGALGCRSPGKRDTDRDNSDETAWRNVDVATANARIQARSQHLFADYLPF